MADMPAPTQPTRPLLHALATVIWMATAGSIVMASTLMLTIAIWSASVGTSGLPYLLVPLAVIALGATAIWAITRIPAFRRLPEDTRALVRAVLAGVGPIGFIGWLWLSHL